MSNDNAQPAALPDVQTATTVLDDLHKRAFLVALAQRGFAAQTEKEAADLWQMDEQLAVLAARSAKSAGDTRYSSAASALETLAKRAGIDVPESAEQAAAHSQTVEHLAANADLYNSVLSFKAAEAAALLEQARGAQGAEGGKDDAQKAA